MLRVVLALAFLVASAAGQVSSSGSQNYVAPVQEVAVAGGASSSGNFKLVSGVGQPFAGHVATSAHYKLRGGLAFASKSLNPLSPPWLLGVLGNTVPTGGASATIVGYNLAPPGAQSIEVFFGDQPATLDGSITNTTLPVITPSGLDSQNTSVGPATLSIFWTVGGSAPAYYYDSVADVFAFLPALTKDGPASLGPTKRLRVTHTSGPFVAVVVVGWSAPGPPLSVPGFSGALLVNRDFYVMGPFHTDTDELQVPLRLPAAAATAVGTIDAQGVIVTGHSPLTGIFTNKLTISLDGQP